MLADGRYEEAAKYLQLAVKFDPDNMLAQINYGITLVKLGRWNEAIAQLAPVARTAPNRIVARTYFARALAGRRDFDQAIAQLQQILQIKPDCGPAQAALQEIESEKAAAARSISLKQLILPISADLPLLDQSHGSPRARWLKKFS